MIQLPQVLQNSHRDLVNEFNRATQQRRIVPLVDDLISKQPDPTS